MRLLPALVALAVSCSGSGGDSATRSAVEERTPRRDAGRVPCSGSQPTPCPDGSAAPAPVGAARTAATPACRSLPFAASVDVPEASGAAWVEASFGLPAHLVVVSDSGNRGALAVVDAASGEALAAGALPVEPGLSDDVEGLARSGGLYYALHSNGRMRRFRRAGAARFEQVEPAYPLPDASCRSARESNCGLDFEGLCLAEPLPASGCVGFAASRRQGELICLERGEKGRLRPVLDRSIRVALPMTLSDCTIAPAAAGGALLAVTNGIGGNQLYRVTGWQDPTRARVEMLPGTATGFIEAVAVGPTGAIYRFSDTGRAPSAMFAESCPAAGPE